MRQCTWQWRICHDVQSMENMNKPLNALLIGRDHGLAWALPQMLTRAGFNVDVITSSPLMKTGKFVRHCDVIPLRQSLLPAIACRLKEHYDWIVITEDSTLGEILQSSLSIEDKLKLLPVRRKENFDHLFSKINLSNVFSAHGINTPPYAVANNATDAISMASTLGYPVLLKIDSSGGGYGVFECNGPSDFNSLPGNLFDKSILVQKKISGIELDLSSLYLEENLIHFSYCKIEKVCMNQFGPSVLRTYTPISSVEEQIFHELEYIGKVLGAHGFTNISCIESAGRRYYIEVDMRPNAWIEFPRYFGEDPSIRIQQWFSRKEKLIFQAQKAVVKRSIIIPYFLRLKGHELLFNRYQVWKYIPRDDWKLVVRLIIRTFLSPPIRTVIILAAKRVIPKKYHPKFRKLKRILF